MSVCTAYGQLTSTPSGTDGLAIQLDYESANAITGLLTQNQVTDAELERIARLFGSQQLIKKVSGYDQSGTEAVFKQTLREVVQTGTVKGHDPYDWKSVKANAGEVRQLIRQLEAKSTFTDDVKALIRPYTPNQIKASVRACFLVGGGALGFVLGDPNTFNLALQKIGDDYEGLVYLVAHELYHSVQGIGDKNRVKQKSTSPPPKPIVNAYVMLENLWGEGSANLVADFTKINAPKSFAKSQREGYQRNGNRARQNFALFESLLFSAYHDSTANLNELYNIGFTLAFDETAYDTGYRMAKVIEKYKGQQALARCISEGPIPFCELYLTVCKENPGEQLIRFSRSTEAIVDKVKVWKDYL
ncbi:hypothetical protein F5984_21890 [Rudanella paleaurantiibacter]|uniref:DUF2268 domain-containing protein n=2 Tax=Rudanella paleaurantiibacter TaxID=2614655 RepID=A0A7J5TU20_9BACT|nr:hypothetical protein F5984_21890 [Rudanella paleaurantiibacter]